MSPGGATSPPFGFGAAGFPLPDEPHAAAASVSPASTIAAHRVAPRVSDLFVTTARGRYAGARKHPVQSRQNGGKSVGPRPAGRGRPSYARHHAARGSPPDRRGR